MPIVLPFVFGTLSGEVPASYLDANFDAIANAVISTSGGTITSGGLFIGTLVSTQPLGTALIVNTDQGAASNIIARTVVEPKSDGSAPNVDVTAIYSGLTVSALFPLTSTPDQGEHVGITSNVDRYLPPESAQQPTPSQPMAQVWSYYGALNDHTNLAASSSGSQTFFEADFYSNNIDDDNRRTGFVINFGASTSVASGGTPNAMSWAFFANTVDGDSIIYSPFFCGATFSSAAYDSRGASGFTCKVAVAAAAGATSISVSKINGFYTSGTYNQPTSVSNPIYKVLIGANYYTVTSATPTGAGHEGGTITIPSPGLLNGSDGALNSNIARVPYSLWMNAGQFIGFDGDSSNIRLGYDTTINNLRLTSSVQVDGLFTAAGNITTGSIYCSGTASIAALNCLGIAAVGEIMANGVASSGGITATGAISVWGVGNPSSRPTLTGTASAITDTNAKAVIQLMASLIAQTGIWIDGLT